jgi:hypothetical protein
MTQQPSLVTGALVGYVSSRVMDAATSRYFETQSQESRDREQEISPDGTLADVGHKVGGIAGKDLPPEQAARVGLFAHRTLGTTYGVIAAALVRRGMAPMVAAPLVGAAAWVIVDEGMALPTFRRYLKESHYRGIIGHGTWGLTAGVLLTLATR